MKLLTVETDLSLIEIDKTIYEAFEFVALI